jgi:hypothetical protein
MQSQKVFRGSREHLGTIVAWPLFPVALLITAQVTIGFSWSILAVTAFLFVFFSSLFWKEIQCKVMICEDRIQMQDSHNFLELEFQQIEGITFHQWIGFHRTPQQSLLLAVRETAPIGTQAVGFYRHFGFLPHERVVEIGLHSLSIRDVGVLLLLLHKAVPKAEVRIGLVDQPLEKALRAGIEQAGGLLERREDDKLLTVRLAS